MSVRQQKVASQIKRAVSLILARDMADPRLNALITVTGVDVTPDLREARVRVSILQVSGPPPATIIQGLHSAAGNIQAELASALPLRYAPRLSFILDESLKKQAEILKKLDAQAAERDRERPAGAPETKPAEALRVPPDSRV